MYTQYVNEPAELDRGPMDNIARSILASYYWSFRYSQGEQVVQRLMLYCIALQYSFSDPAELDRIQKSLDGAIGQLKVPERHAKKTRPDSAGKVYDIDHNFAQTSAGGFQNVWDFFKIVLTQVSANTPVPAETINNVLFASEVFELIGESTEEIHLRLLNLLTQKEILYQREPRPERDGASDEHESLIREYVLEGNAAATDQFTQLFADLRETIKNHGLMLNPFAEGYVPRPDDTSEIRQTRVRMHDIASWWEEHHPGKKFFSRDL